MPDQLVIDRLEGVAIFGSDDLLVPNCVCQLVPITDIERAVIAHHGARSGFEVHDIGTVRAHTFLNGAIKKEL